MEFKILTLFPDMVMSGLSESITGRAMGSGLISIEAVDIRSFSNDKHGRVDDYTYGGGAGMLMQAQPVFDAYKSVAKSGHPRCVYVTPQGRPFTQNMAHDFAAEEELVILCGHYEGIDERVLEEVVTDYVSIGDYVLTGGELAAMVIVDAVSRLVPGVLGNSESAVGESFHGALLEYPQYSRPEVWHEKRVPAELLSGDPKKVNAWRLEHAKRRTAERRPDLYEIYEADIAGIDRMLLKKRALMPMIEAVRRGLGHVTRNDEAGVEVWCETTGLKYVWDAFSNELLLNDEPLGKFYVYTPKEQLPQPKINVREATLDDLDSCVLSFGGKYPKNELKKLITHGFVFISDDGFCLENIDGALDVSDSVCASELVAYIVNRQLQKGYTPYTFSKLDFLSVIKGFYSNIK